MSSDRIRSFSDLIVWQRAFALCVDVYRSTREFPVDERYGLVVELRKTTRSLVYNIAEGHGRRSTAEYLHFLEIAGGSAAELESQLMLSHALHYLDNKVSEHLLSSLHEVGRLLAGLKRSLRKSRVVSPP